MFTQNQQRFRISVLKSEIYLNKVNKTANPCRLSRNISCSAYRILRFRKMCVGTKQSNFDTEIKLFGVLFTSLNRPYYPATRHQHILLDICSNIWTTDTLLRVCHITSMLRSSMAQSGTSNTRIFVSCFL